MLSPKTLFFGVILEVFSSDSFDEKEEKNRRQA